MSLSPPPPAFTPHKAAKENFLVDAFQGAIIVLTIVAKIIKAWVMSLLNAGKCSRSWKSFVVPAPFLN